MAVRVEAAKRRVSVSLRDKVVIVNEIKILNLGISDFVRLFAILGQQFRVPLSSGVADVRSSTFRFIGKYPTIQSHR